MPVSGSQAVGWARMSLPKLLVRQMMVFYYYFFVIQMMLRVMGEKGITLKSTLRP
jgi:hypothetical protein